MPKFSIVDHSKINKYFIVWQENGFTKTKSRKYGTRLSKQEAYQQMIDIRYELVTCWLRINKGMTSIGTQWESNPY